jgi:hypothetical protein
MVDAVAPARCSSSTTLSLGQRWATQGSTTFGCAAHNQLHARECFGARHIEAKIAARRGGGGGESGGPGRCLPEGTGADTLMRS